MAVVTLTPPCNTKLTETLSLDTNNKSLPDASFSLYMSKASRESFVRRHSVSDRHLSIQDNRKNRFGILSEDVGELGVFGADKYFSGVMDQDESTSRVIKEGNARKIQCQRENGIQMDQLHRILIPSKIKQPGTPSVRSESSWNGRSVLLNNFIKNPFRTKNRKANGKSFLAIFGCKCSCYDKISVAVQDQVGEISFSTSVPSQSTKADPKRVPDLNMLPIKNTNSKSWFGDKVMQNWTIDKKGAAFQVEVKNVKFPASNSDRKDDEEIQQRKSLEVFGSPVYEKRSKSLALDPKRLPRLSWDAKAKVKPELEISGDVFSDCESDASSDLFELDSITGITSPVPAKKVSNASSDCVTSTTCHAQTGIQWKVATASAADFTTNGALDYEIQGYVDKMSCYS